MMQKLLPILALLIGAASASAQAPLSPGDRLPPPGLEGLTQCEVGSYAGFYGRAVLLEFFAFWCGPCAQSVAHLNELQEKYGARGFSVLGITSENPGKTEPWIKKHGAEYAYGYDTSGELHKQFAVTGIPFSALIDPFGNVLWTGHPMALTEEKVEEALVGTLPRPVWEWPKEARPLAGLLTKGQYASALAQAQKLPAEIDFDLPALVQSRVAPLVAKFDGYLEEEDYPRAVKLGTHLEKEFAGLPEGEKLAVRMNELRGNPVAMRQVEAFDRVSVFEQRGAALRKIAEATKLREEIVEFMKVDNGKKIERRAKALVDAIDRSLEKVKKP